MRVTCEKCSSAYAVDDKLIPPKGVRAQCPKCKNLQVVKRAEEGAAAAPAAPAPAPRAAPPPPAWPPTGPAAAAPARTMAPPAAPAGARAVAAQPAPAPPPPPPKTAAETAPVAKCRSCAKPLPDALDAALGMCEDCRQKEQAEVARPPPGSTKVPAKPPPPPSTRAVKTPATDLFGDELPGAEAGEGSLELDLGDDKQKRAAAVAVNNGAPVAAPSTANASKAPIQQRGVVMTSERGGPSTGKIVGGLLGVALLGGLIFLGVTRPAWLMELLPRSQPKASLIAPAIEKRLAGWKLSMPDLAGTAGEHFVKGRKLYLQDRPTDYRSAEEEFKAAILLDPQDMRAVAHYVEAYSVGHNEALNEDEKTELRELIATVLTARADMSVGHRAKANFLLAVGETDTARLKAEEALKLAGVDEQAEALLALGRTYLRKSAQVARDKFEAALAKDKTLKRAYYYRGLAAEYGGRYAQAIDDYEERLKLDPDQREALGAQARVYASLGDYQSARKALARYAAKHPDVGEPRVALVQLAYAVERDLKEADRTLKKLNGEYDKFDDADKLQLLTLWAAVARERGENAVAEAQGKAALKIDPKYAPAHFQLMLLALTQKKVPDAKAHLEACVSRLDEARLHEYRGRIAGAAGDFPGAIDELKKAMEAAPSRIGPLLQAAAFLVKKGDEDAAFLVMRKAMNQDTTSLARTRRPVSDFFESPVESVRIAQGAFESLKGGDTPWLPSTYAAIVQYHLGAFDPAERLLEDSLKHDEEFFPALLYRAQMELDHKRFDKALELAQRASRVEREAPMGLYLQGRAFDGLKKKEDALRAYSQVLSKDPTNVSANLRLAEIAAEGGDKAEAKKKLLQVMSIEPENMEGRVALFKLGY